MVTKGDYPELVRNNVQRNVNTCLDVGLENFFLQVATDKSISLSSSKHAHELVVPDAYQTKSGAMFKARALQYCLEDKVIQTKIVVFVLINTKHCVFFPKVNQLGDNDWIVHLDEETILTPSSVKGIINFVTSGKHQFGQGMITYANEEVGCSFFLYSL